MQYTQNSSLNADLSSAQQSIANINALSGRRTKILPVPLPPTAFLKDRPIDNNSIFIRPSRPRVVEYVASMDHSQRPANDLAVSLTPFNIYNQYDSTGAFVGNIIHFPKVGNDVNSQNMRIA